MMLTHKIALDATRKQADYFARACGVAFSRTGDPATGEFEEAQVIAVYGAVDVGRLEG